MNETTAQLRERLTNADYHINAIRVIDSLLETKNRMIVKANNCHAYTVAKDDNEAILWVLRRARRRHESRLEQLGIEVSL